MHTSLDKRQCYPAFLTNPGRPETVCHCFVRSSAVKTSGKTLLLAKQWHTVVRNAGCLRYAACVAVCGLLAFVATGCSRALYRIRADRQVSYGLIVELMDISRRVGMEKIVALTEGGDNPRGGPGIEDLLKKNEEKDEE